MHLQALYRAYSVKQRRPFLKCFITASLLYDGYCLLVPFEQELANRGITCLFLAANLCLLFVSLRARRRFVWTTLPHLAWHAANLQILARLFLGRDLTPRDDLSWVLLIEYLIYTTLPLSLRYCVVLALGTFATYVRLTTKFIVHFYYFLFQIAANTLLMIGANLLGLLSSYLEDVQQKKAFLDTKQCLEMKLVIEEQSDEQERLLLSVLPEHVAVKMRQDLGSALDTQFKKIYMSRHENVRDTSSLELRFSETATIVSVVRRGKSPITLTFVYTWDYPWSKQLSELRFLYLDIANLPA
ncbi:unnamed protein product [Nesidiocoris tenuis]|uniref:Adenylate cyclase N-terminal domain-containing protein n=1 Tax=Nesidiocoris tenuis TaxID=355587 RepID=A0A6H5GRV0_9HEMI|nr:unnamed protein product [Nesidiocoris tenuis]